MGRDGLQREKATFQSWKSSWGSKLQAEWSAVQGRLPGNSQNPFIISTGSWKEIGLRSHMSFVEAVCFGLDFKGKQFHRSGCPEHLDDTYIRAQL